MLLRKLLIGGILAPILIAAPAVAQVKHHEQRHKPHVERHKPHQPHGHKPHTFVPKPHTFVPKPHEHNHHKNS